MKTIKKIGWRYNLLIFAAFLVATMHWIQFHKYFLFIECAIGYAVILFVQYKLDHRKS
jgi:cell division protein FtsB